MATEKRLIDANELLEQIQQADADVFDAPPPGYCSLGGDDWGYSYDTIARIVRNAPTVDAVEVVHGRWVKRTDICDALEIEEAYSCSECGKSAVTKHNFCSRCGAKMDGEKEAEGK